MGFLPRGDVFVHSNDKHIEQAIVVFRMMYFAKDFDTFIRTACFLRERINGGMFVYAFTCAVFHREDCRGVILPAPYEIYPYFFVDSHVINKAFMLKSSKAATDPVLFDYYGIKVTDKNLVFIDWRKGVRHVMSEDDRLNYFTEDFDLNTFFYYLHMNYPYWMVDDEYGLNKERRGEITMFGYQQLLARYRLERLGHGMCDIPMINFKKTLNNGYWPKIRLHTGDEMPVRSNNVQLINKYNFIEKTYIDDIETIIRDSINKGRYERVSRFTYFEFDIFFRFLLFWYKVYFIFYPVYLIFFLILKTFVQRDGTVVSLKKPEDFEYLARMLLGGMGIVNDDAKVIHLVHLFRKLLSYSTYNFNK